MIKSFENNTRGYDFVVGDIHGAINTLYKALDLMGFNPDKDRMFSVGDLVDRGSESSEYPRLLAEPWFHAVRGNHEVMAIEVYMETWPLDNYIYNGGGWNYVDRQKVAEDFAKLPYLIEVKVGDKLYGIVHADPTHSSWETTKAEVNNDMDRYVWSRARINSVRGTPLSNSEDLIVFDGQKIAGVEAVIVGHTPSEKVVQVGNVYHIDTAWWYSDTKPVTFICLNTMEIINVAVD